MARRRGLERLPWKKVEAPIFWRPREVGAQLVGFYMGRTLRTGSYGQYEVVMIFVPGEGAYIVSGTKIVQLIDASGLTRGEPVKVLWMGEEPLKEGKKMKMFEVYTIDEEKMADEDLPAMTDYQQ